MARRKVPKLPDYRPLIRQWIDATPGADIQSLADRAGIRRATLSTFLGGKSDIKLATLRQVVAAIRNW